VVLTSCDDARVYEDFQQIDGSWDQDSVFEFRFSITDPEVLYTLSTELRHSNLYQYSNIYLNYEISGPSDYQYAELKEALLFDTRTGKPYGNGLGDVFDSKIILLEGHKFNAAGEYAIRISQFMRTEKLKEVERIGFRVAYTAKE
jgi:gliding motility-associated lipoprotein GldH